MERPMNTANKYRGVHERVVDYVKGSEKRHTPVTRVKVAKAKNGAVDVQLYTSRPEILRMETTGLREALQEDAPGRDIQVSVVAEARAVAKFVRMSPRKIRLVIAAIKGKRVSEALDMLRFIPNHAAAPLAKVIASAAANAQESWGAGPDELKVANVIADGGPTLKRIRARAQGRAYRILKRTSHITAVLLETPAPVRKPKAPAKPKKAAPAKPVPAKPAAKAPAAKPAAKAKTEAVAETPAETPEVVIEQTAPEAVAQVEQAASAEPAADAPFAEESQAEASVEGESADGAAPAEESESGEAEKA